MSTSESFDEVINRLRAGDQEAAAEIFQRYATRLIHLARSRLDTRMRVKVDPESVAQSAFRSFFVRQAKGQFELTDWDGLWSLLVQITLRKCGHQIAAHHAARRDLRRETSPVSTDHGSGVCHEAIAREPTPDEAACLTETLQQLMSGLDEKQQEMLILRLQGYTIEEISQQVGRTERTVHRVLAAVRQGLARLVS